MTGRHGGNKQYWADKSKEYPYHAKTSVLHPKPTDVAKATYGNFVAVPLNSSRLWGFELAEARDAFIEAFGGTSIDGDTTSG